MRPDHLAKAMMARSETDKKREAMIAVWSLTSQAFCDILASGFRHFTVLTFGEDNPFWLQKYFFKQFETTN